MAGSLISGKQQQANMACACLLTAASVTSGHSSEESAGQEIQ